MRAEWWGSSFNRNKGPVVSLHSLTLSPSFPSSVITSLPPVLLLILVAPYFPSLPSSFTSCPDSTHFTCIFFHPAFLNFCLFPSLFPFLVLHHFIVSILSVKFSDEFRGFPAWTKISSVATPLQHSTERSVSLVVCDLYRRVIVPKLWMWTCRFWLLSEAVTLLAVCFSRLYCLKIDRLLTGMFLLCCLIHQEQLSAEYKVQEGNAVFWLESFHMSFSQCCSVKAVL